MRTNLGQAEDRKRTYKGPHRQKVQLYRIVNKEIKLLEEIYAFSKSVIRLLLTYLEPPVV